MRPCGDVSADPCSDGNFYGTAAAGGSNGFGTIFELTSGGAFNSLYSFFCTAASCSDGAIPYAGLLQGTNGTFYGTTSDGGDYRTSHNLGDGVAYSWSMGLGPFAEAQFNFGKDRADRHYSGEPPGGGDERDVQWRVGELQGDLQYLPQSANTNWCDYGDDPGDNAERDAE
jgi:uncharacterized repeat protein (TIGR03803 family)